MDKRIDYYLQQAAQHASHPGLRTLEGAVLDRIGRERIGRTQARRLDVISFAGALIIGVASTLVFAGPSSSYASTPINGLSPLAPSVLLERHR